MIAGIVSHHSDPRLRGELHGRHFAPAVRHNINRFRNAAVAAGWDFDVLRGVAGERARNLADVEKIELQAIAHGAGVNSRDHLAFALVGHVVAPEECTVAAAVGNAAASGSTVLLKNSDKIGADTMVGDGYYHYKEVNVVVDLRGDDGVRILGMAAAGSTGLKMGVNGAGVAAASNIVRTTELRLRSPSVDDLLALDRGGILRTGLSYRSAWEATTWAMDAISATPMATPGNIHFAESNRMFVIEGSYDRLAMERVEDRIVARSNMFILLSDLNDPADTSSPARYARALELLAPHSGSVTAGHLRTVSQDHEGGPGLDSICRHSDDYIQETSLSAMVVAFDRADPQHTRIDFALGKPCWAWNNPNGVLSVTPADAADTIQDGFRDGQAWRELYREDAFEV